ncbi:hypothetical protein [Methylomonas sp. AM2-LC]
MLMTIGIPTGKIPISNCVMRRIIKHPQAAKHSIDAYQISAFIRVIKHH